MIWINVGDKSKCLLGGERSSQQASVLLVMTMTFLEVILGVITVNNLSHGLLGNWMTLRKESTAHLHARQVHLRRHHQSLMRRSKPPFL